MRICIVNYRYFVSSGAERYMFGLTDLLERAGHEVIPFSVRYRANRPSPWAAHFVSPIAGEDEVYFRDHSWTPRSACRAISRAFYSSEVYAALSRLLEDAKPDVALVLNYLRKLSPAVLVALKDHGVPIAVRLSDFGLVCAQPNMVRNGRACEDCLRHGLWPSVRHRCVQHSLGASLINAFAMTYAKRQGFFDLVDAFVAPSSILREKMIAGGLAQEKIRHIPTFVETQPRTPVAARHRLVCFNGRIDEGKGVGTLLDAFTILRGRGSSSGVELRIAGDLTGPEAVRQREHARRQGTEGIVFTGPLEWDDLLALVSRSMVCVVPSVCYENMPNALLESLACGTPVVASDHGSMREIIAGTGAGALFRPGDAQSLADALLGLLTEPAELERMSRLAHELAGTRYAPERHLESMVDLLAGLVEGARP